MPERGPHRTSIVLAEPGGADGGAVAPDAARAAFGAVEGTPEVEPAAEPLGDLMKARHVVERRVDPQRGHAVGRLDARREHFTRGNPEPDRGPT